MSVERYGKALLINKKNYVYTSEGEIKHKGISVVRKDRVSCVNTVVELVQSAAAASAPARLQEDGRQSITNAYPWRQPLTVS